MTTWMSEPNHLVKRNAVPTIDMNPGDLLKLEKLAHQDSSGPGP